MSPDIQSGRDADDAYIRYFLNTREIIPRMLSLFGEYEVHVTWATVGMLFHETRADLLANLPSARPAYQHYALSAYQYIDREGIGTDEAADPFHFAPSLIRQVAQVPHQEIGTHTFAHYYCNEAGQTAQQFRADLQAAKRAAARFERKLTSLVFPRNQFNDQYLKVCFEEGITAVRSNPLDWFWNIQSTQNESWWKRLNRGMDAYFPMGRRNTYSLHDIHVREGFPVCIPASRLLRPYRPKEVFLNQMKIDRVRNEMSRAAQRGEVYHLWWHPHNFGYYPQESLEGLKAIMTHYQSCRSKWAMRSLNMGELAHVLTTRSRAIHV
ncbi:MAG TPA: polysaccharide deacetylase family protein [Chryseosolibacter sp.]|nr:polysaccharide deacetylase family protein [Chryseosolibacter sp.]